MSDNTNGPVGQPEGEQHDEIQPQPTQPTEPLTEAAQPAAEAQAQTEQLEPAAAEAAVEAPQPASVEPATAPTAPVEPVQASADTRPAPRYGEYAQPQQTQPTQPIAPAAAAPAQPVQPQPTQPYPGQQAPQYGAPQQPYGQPAPQGQQYPSSFAHPGAQQNGQHPGAQQPYAAYGTGAFFEQQAPKPPRERKPLSGKTIALIAAGLVVGAILGGAAGGGIGAAVNSGRNQVVASSNSGAQNITVNDPADATQITAVAQAASPSVVTINVTSSQESGTGSGVVLTSDGYILTNTHVVTLDGAVAGATIQVQTNDGKLYSAKVIGTDPTDDLAVIKLDGASGLTPIKFADSSKLNVGQQVVAIGAPLGLAGTVTDGIISSLNRSISIASSAAPTGGDQSQQGDGSGGSDGSNGGDSPFNFWNFGGGDGSGSGGSDGSGSSQSAPQATIALPTIQTDASINPGNSGGALLNTKGELIGINVAIASTGGTSADGSQSGSIGVGFAIPSNVAQRIADELKSSGTATHGLLGATVGDASAATDATTVGAKIQDVTSGGAADKGGLKSGDVITNINGVPVTNATDLTAQVRSSAGGSQATITYVRGNQTEQTTVTLGTYNPNS